MKKSIISFKIWLAFKKSLILFLNIERRVTDRKVADFRLNSIDAKQSSVVPPDKKLANRTKKRLSALV